MTTGANTRLILTTLLTLALAQLCLPAEGFVLSKLQSTESNLITRRHEMAGCAVHELGGDWEFYLNEETSGTTRVPCSFTGTDHPVEFTRLEFIPDSFSYYDWELLIPEYRYRVDVTINGNLLLAGRGDFASLRVPIRPEYLLYGSENEFLLSIQNDLNRSTSVPLKPGLLQPASYAGIMSKVYLIGRQKTTFTGCAYLYDCKLDSTERTYRTDLRIKPQVIRNRIPPDDTLSAAIDLADILIHAVLYDTQRVAISRGSMTLADYYTSSHSHPLQLPEFIPIIWTAESPYLYALDLFLIHRKDTLSQWHKTAAFEVCDIDSEGFNDGLSTFLLKSVDYVLQDAVGLPPSLGLLRSDLQSIKEYGFNTIRVRGSLPTEGLLSIADSMGIWVVADLGLNSIPNRLITDDYLNQIRSGPLMQVIQDSRDHPSLLAVCCGSLLEFSESQVDSIVNLLTGDLRALTDLLCFVESAETIPADIDCDFVMLSRNPYDVSLPKSDQDILLPIVYSNLGFLSPNSSKADSLSTAVQYMALEYQTNQVFSSKDCIGFSIHTYADYLGASPLILQKGERSDSRYLFGLVTANRLKRHNDESIQNLIGTGSFESGIVYPRKAKPNPIVFPSFALIAVLILSAAMRSNNVLRQNLRRVFRHSHGFFSDIRYRRYLPTSHTLLLWIMNSAATTGVVVSMAYWLRDSLRLDYLLTFVGLSSTSKLFIASLLWSPGQAIAIVFSIVLAVKLLHIFYLKIISNLFRPRVSLGQIWKYTNWAFAPMLFLLPLSAVLYRLLDFEVLVIPTLALCGLVLFWCLIRLISALQNGFQSSFFRVSLLFILLTGILAASFYFSIDHWLHFPKYWQWLLHVYPL